MNRLAFLLWAMIQTVTSLASPLTIHGSGFQNFDFVTAAPSGLLCTNVTVVSPTVMTASCPQGTTSVKVTHRHHVSLKWNAATLPTGAPPVKSYSILRGSAITGPFTFLSSTTGLTYSDLAVTASVKYCYTVQAVNANGSSANATPICFTIP